MLRTLLLAKAGGLYYGRRRYDDPARKHKSRVGSINELSTQLGLSPILADSCSSPAAGDLRIVKNVSLAGGTHN